MNWNKVVMVLLLVVIFLAIPIKFAIYWPLSVEVKPFNVEDVIVTLALVITYILFVRNTLLNKAK